MLFDVHICEFSAFPLVLISNFMKVLSEEICGMISVLMNFLRLILLLDIWSVIENVACVLVYSVVFG